MIKILLVEDDEVFQLGLSMSLKNKANIEVVGQINNGNLLDSFIKNNPLDIILMDVGLPQQDGIELTKQVKQSYPNIKVLVLTSHSDSKIVEKIMAAGADGFCLKGISSERLLTAIQEVYQGVFWIDESVASHIKSYFKGESVKNDSNELINSKISSLLTERELEVLKLIAKGYKNLDIAEELVISPGTVRVHVHSILNKLKVKDRTQAALLAFDAL